MNKREKAWSWVEGLLLRVGGEGVPAEVLNAILKEVGYRVPYDVINDWDNEGRLRIVNGEHGDGHYENRRYALPTQANS